MPGSWKGDAVLPVYFICEAGHLTLQLCLGVELRHYAAACEVIAVLSAPGMPQVRSSQ